MRIVGRIFKYFVLLLLVVIALVALLPLLPVAKDKIGAGKYKSWLEAEMVPLDLSEPDAGFKFPDTLGNARLIMLSEIHGYRAVQKLDLALITYLNKNFGVRTYLAEMSPAQAMAVNSYILGRSDGLTKRVFDNWAEETAQWGNQDFFDKLTAIRELNGDLSYNDRIRFLGIDQIQNREFAEGLFPADVEDEDFEYTSGFASAYNVFVLNAELLADALEREEGMSRYEHIMANIELVMQAPGAEDEIFYGLWGLFHGSKVTINGGEPLAMRLNRENAPFENSVLTIGTICVDGCFNMMPAFAAPPPFQPKNGEPYVLMPMNYDSAYLARLRGIDEVKSAMGEERVAMIRLAAEGSPYLSGPRLVKATGYITMMNPFVYQGPAGDAMDYVIVIRGSAALTPWKGEAYDVTGGNAAKAGID